MNGVLVVDKPSGCTSHDIVQCVRKAIQQRSVGHAGTLDPLATGVLVVAIGEGTKLVPYLQADDKHYEVVIALGAETDSLDADGLVTRRASVPALDASMVEVQLQRFLGRRPQRAPRISAIKVGGTPLHRRARRGEDLEAPVREVELYAASVEEVGTVELRLLVHCGKGFYVRSLARDLARSLGTVGHVAALRRTASGPFGLDRAVTGEALTLESIRAGLISIPEACGGLARLELTESGVDHARHGRPIGADDIRGTRWYTAAPEQTFALFGPTGRVIALGRRETDRIRVVRGFAPDT